MTVFLKTVFILCTFNTIICYEYRLIPLQLTCVDANSYCLDECDSRLASIHSEQEYDATYILAKSAEQDGINDYIWIGLYRSGLNFAWFDSSNFDYGHLMDGNKPWDTSQPTRDTAEYAVRMNKNNYLWHDTDCSLQSYFLCNSCLYRNYAKLKTYHVSLINAFNTIESEKYCNQHCNSNLASIHNEIDMQRIIYLAKNSYDRMSNLNIGLIPNINNNILQWIDDSGFDDNNNDYGSNLHIYPWYNSPDGGNECVQMKYDKLYEWDSEDCDIQQQFVCNHCDGVLNKYIINKQDEMTFIDANSYCMDQYNTSLASLHGEDDVIEIRKQLLISNTDQIWIGLNDQNNDGSYQWSDNTGVYIGGAAEYGNGQCLYMKSLLNDTVLQIADLCTKQRRFICAAPSALCDDTNWIRIDGDWNYQHCVYNNYDVNILNVGEGRIMSDKEWINNNGVLMIEYMFKMLRVSGYNQFKAVGITIHNFKDSICNYYYIAIRVTDIASPQFELQFIKNMNGNIEILGNINLSGFQYHAFHAMRIKVINGTYFEIVIDDELLLNITDYVSYDDIESMITSGYIGLSSYDLQITAKWLYISGSIWNVKKITSYNMDINQCTTISITETPQNYTNSSIITTTASALQTTTSFFTTIDPISIPSTNPTTMPSVHPTMVPTSAPRITTTILARFTSFPSITKNTNVDGEQIDDETTTNTINIDQDEERQNLLNELTNLKLLEMIILGVIVLLCFCVCCLGICFCRKCHEKRKRKQTNNETALDQLNLPNQPLNISKISRSTTGTTPIVANNRNISSYKTSNIRNSKIEEMPAVELLEMEGGRSWNNNNNNNTAEFKKSKTEEFKQMLGDKILSNKLMMDDIVNSMDNDQQRSHETAGGHPNLIREGTANNNNNNKETKGGSNDYNYNMIPPSSPNAVSAESEEDIDIILYAKKTIGGDEANIARDEFIINGNDDDDEMVVTPTGNEEDHVDNNDNNDSDDGSVVIHDGHHQNHVISGPVTNGAPDDDDENVPSPPLPPTQYQGNYDDDDQSEEDVEWIYDEDESQEL